MPPARSPVAEVLSKLSDLLAALGVRYYLFGVRTTLDMLEQALDRPDLISVFQSLVAGRPGSRGSEL
jgi:hypothetical protein